MSLLISLGLAGPKSSTTIGGFDWEGDGSERDYCDGDFNVFVVGVWGEQLWKQCSFIRCNIKKKESVSGLGHNLVLLPCSLFSRSPEKCVHISTNTSDKAHTLHPGTIASKCVHNVQLLYWYTHIQNTQAHRQMHTEACHYSADREEHKHTHMN